MAVLCDMNGSPYTGWRVENGKKFYYDNGKSCKGWKKIGRQYYYFDGKNGLAKNKIVGSKKNGYYYIMCAEGGTGYNHCVTMGRSRNIWGPYEKRPEWSCGDFKSGGNERTE